MTTLIKKTILSLTLIILSVTISYARYYDAQLSKFISVDPALNDYLPNPNQKVKLPGMGGVYNPVNLDLYHYTGNNPVRYTDPTGKWTNPTKEPELVSHFERWHGDRVGKYNPSKSSFGWVRKNSDGTKRGHGGIDIRTLEKQLVYAVGDGRIVRSSNYGSFGGVVVLKFKYQYNFFNFLEDVFTGQWSGIGNKVKKSGTTYFAYYTHLYSRNVSVGDTVKEGQILGEAGRSGNASGIPTYRTHLHFSISEVYPATSRNRELKPDYSNSSWIDPAQFFQNLETNPVDNRNWQGEQDN